MKSRVYSTSMPAGSVSFNVVPLVDCVFLMILFFILTSQIADPGVAGQVFLAKPTQSQAKDADKEGLKDKLLVNVISREPVSRKDEALIDPNLAGQAKGFTIGTSHFDLQDQAGLTSVFRKRKQELMDKGVRAEDFCIVVRCDWRVQYADVVPVLTAAAEAGIPKMNITVLKSANERR